jgi:hypothetical protein
MKSKKRLRHIYPSPSETAARKEIKSGKGRQHDVEDNEFKETALARRQAGNQYS